jgi:hypothetical protein
MSWLSTVDHKRIGILYILSSFFFLAVGGVEALLIRIQLARPENHFLTGDAYNQVFTLHGTTMVFLVVIPLLLGISVYLVPLMIGASDMVFPRMNALGYWNYLFGGILIYLSFGFGGAPNAGWFAYAPLSEKAYSFQPGMDYWALGLLVAGAGTVLTAINIVATVIKLRAPGMTLRRVPLFVWMVLVNSLLILFAMPPLNAALAMLFIDRQLQGHFFTPSSGGSALLWQHYFWSFGHPEVYIMVLPAFGVISEVIPVFSRKPIYGYGFVACSTVRLDSSYVRGWTSSDDLLSFGSSKHDHRSSHGCENIQLDRNDVGWRDPIYDGDAFRARFSSSIHDRGPYGSDVCGHSDRLAVDGHLLRSRAHALCFIWRDFLCFDGRGLLLVSKSDGTHAFRKDWKMAFLADGAWL